MVEVSVNRPCCGIGLRNRATGVVIMISRCEHTRWTARRSRRFLPHVGFMYRKHAVLLISMLSRLWTDRKSAA